MRVLQLRGELDLAPEPLDVDGRGEIRQQHLHHHFASERSVLGDEDPRHAAATELALEDVGGAQCCLELVPEIGHSRM